ncbi:uncharacterized protein [Choristoneura fumiferana]|uniref:uncharacterized protein n=1 Tax=Choristoneura fumiferana TaxID=7141 RepID=UPI003D15EA45
MKNCFKCCYTRKRRSDSGGEDSPYFGSNGSVDNMSMISVTYGLESFNKNALLLFCQVTGEQGSRNRYLTMKAVAMLKETFQKYRFEVDCHIDLTSTEVQEKCDEFFSRDFSEYGAVVVVILAADGKPGMLSASDQMFHETVILKHFTTDVPLTLRGKPKIYITEANRMKTLSDDEIDDHRGGGASAPIKDCYEDILGLHIPSVIEDEVRSPLHIFCERMNASEDQGNMIGIMIGSVEEIEETFPDLTQKLELVCTFLKRCTLPMFVLIE